MRRLFSWLRLVNVDDRDHERLRRGGRWQDKDVAPLSARNERAALASLAAAAEAALAATPVLEARPDDAPLVAAAVRLRQGERRVARALLDFAALALDALGSRRALSAARGRRNHLLGAYLGTLRASLTA
jgi:hypothetical protein